MDTKLQKDTKKTDFEFRDKIEAWVEGIFNTLDIFGRTIARIQLRPIRSTSIIQTDPTTYTDFSLPGVYMVLSYIAMLALIKETDYSDPVVLLNLTKILNTVGVLEAVKTLSVEAIIASIIPAIGLLFYFVYTHKLLLFILRDKSDRTIIRRAYCYILGTLYLNVASIFTTYTYIAKPLQANYPKLALVAHILSFWPMIGAIMLAILLLQRGEMGQKGFWKRAIASTLVWAILLRILSYFSGNSAVFDYLKSTQ